MEGYPAPSQRQGPSPLVIVGIVMIALACLCIVGVGGGMLLMGPQISQVFEDIQSELGAEAPAPGVVELAPPASGQTGGGSGECNVNSANASYSGNDSYTTTFVSCVALNQRSESTYIGSLSEAHNWLFYGQSGQSVRIRVGGEDGIDPRVNLIDPQGEVIASEDDNNGYNVDFEITLPESGLYVVRIDIFNAGNYTVLVEGQ